MALTVVSLVVMVLIDRFLGSRAEFLNAWSALERIVRGSSTATPSVVASRLGAAGEFVVVLAVNLSIGFGLAALVRYLMRVL